MSNLLEKASILLTPTAYDDGKILSVKPEDGTGDFDFTRNSSATRVNSEGLIEDVQILSSNLVSNGDFSQEGSELITNGDFATDSDWNLRSAWVISNGNCSLTPPNSDYLSQASVLTLNKSYKLTFDIVVNSGNIQPQFYDGGFQTIGTYNTTQTVEVYFKPTSSGTLYFKPNLFDGSIDNVSVKEVGQDWTLLNDVTSFSFENGIANIQGTSNSANNGIKQSSISSVIGKTYKISATLRSNDGGLYRFRLLDGSYFDLGSGNSSEFETITSYHTATSTAFTILATSWYTSGTEDFSISNISVIEITDDTNLPRIDYTGGEGHWLFEPQSSNRVTYSEDFSQWGQSGTPTLTSGQLAPDGTFGATKISGTIGSSYIALGQASTTTATRTIYAKTVSGTGTAKLMSYNGNTNNLFTLTEDWQRFELTGSSATGGTSFYIDLRDNAQTLSEFIIWGAQSEELSFATSYIPTNGSTVTRLKDAAFGAGNSDLINSTEGVLYAEIAALANENVQRISSISDGTANNTIQLGFLNSATNYKFFASVRVGGAFQAFMVYDFGAVQPAFKKVAVKYKQNDFALWIDGVKVVTDTNGNVPTGLNKLSFDRGDGGQDFYGKTKCVAVFKEALTDEELTCLTTI